MICTPPYRPRRWNAYDPSCQPRCDLDFTLRRGGSVMVRSPAGGAGSVRSHDERHSSLPGRPAESGGPPGLLQSAAFFTFHTAPGPVTRSTYRSPPPSTRARCLVSPCVIPTVGSPRTSSKSKSAGMRQRSCNPKRTGGDGLPSPDCYRSQVQSTGRSSNVSSRTLPMATQGGAS